MTTTAHPLPLAVRPARRTAFDWVFAALVVLGAVFGFQRYGASMDVYEKGIAACAVPAAIALGWFWAPLRPLMIGVALAAGAAMALYLRTLDDFGVDLAKGEQVFWLKYMLSSQSAILWMSLLLFMSTAFYWAGLVMRRDTPTLLGSKLAWGGVFMALVGTLVRWFESHQIAPDIGHIPVSNLYEVFVLFAWMTTLFWLYYEDRYRRAGQPLGGLGAFVMLVVSAAVGFLLWYALTRNAHEIQPLVPALQSWWMKIHVPANFVGYGTFALAAMVALAYLLKTATPRALWVGLVYKAIAVGFAFFTIATILGAFWAAEAWGGYWSWDPKETWALIVWLNYAAWLHMRLMKGLRGTFAAWWSLVGLVVTTFAFLGVNMFLSGLHSYGQL